MSSSQQPSRPAGDQDSPPHLPFCTSTRPTAHPANSDDIDRLIEHTESLFNHFSDSFDGILGVLITRLDRLEESLVAAIEGENMPNQVRDSEGGASEICRARHEESGAVDSGSLTGSGSVSSSSSSDDDLYY